MIRRSIWYTLCFVLFVTAQTCENYGLLNGTSCICPTGFGGSTCSELGCGGTIFQGSQRPLTSSAFTASTCNCEMGWTGTGCNVCQTANACQSGFAAVGQVSIASTFSGLQGNDTLVCNTQPRVWASSQMSCQINNPTLQAIYPLASTLNIIRTLQPGFSPIPNATSFGVAGSAFAQLFYNGSEQFYCQANSCTQQLGSTDGSADWECSNLQCTCRPGTAFCGAVSASNLTSVINGLSGTLGISCGALNSSSSTASCNFKQSVLQSLFGSNGLTLNGCSFGECVQQGVIDMGSGSTSNSTQSASSTSKPLSGGVIAGLAVVGALIILSLFFLILGLKAQRAARRKGFEASEGSKVSVEWSQLSYIMPGLGKKNAFLRAFRKAQPDPTDINNDKVILDSVNGKVKPGQMMAILGPSGAGKTTLVEILSGKNKSGVVSGRFSFLSESHGAQTAPRVGFVPQQDILPPTLTVFEALLFAARLRLPESITDAEKHERVDILLEKLGIAPIKHAKIGDITGGRARGISGGEMRRVSIGLELIACPDVLLLDEPTSGLDSVSAARVADVLHAIAHDPVKPTPIIASIHQPSSQLYQKFDLVVLLSHGRALYSGPGGFAPAEYFSNAAPGTVAPYQKGYNVAEYLLEVANDPPASLFQLQPSHTTTVEADGANNELRESTSEKASAHYDEKGLSSASNARADTLGHSSRGYATTFLTQLQYLCGREWKNLKRDKTLFLTHVAVASILGVFCGGLYFNTNITIAGFQSRVGCLFFLGALIAFSSLSALYNIVEVRPLFLRERSGKYYSPTAWLLSRFIFDVIPLRLIPTIIVSTITYWMAGLAPSAAHFFKFLLMLVLYTLAMTLYNFLLGTFFKNGGIAILLSALSALYQMTFAGFFLHLNSIPPVLRWLQWLCPLKYSLEALSVNEVESGLQIVDVLQGVPVDISAIVIMNLLFGFELNNYYRDILVMVGFILGFGIGVIGVVWFTVRERR